MYALPGPAYGLPPLTGYNDHNTHSGKRKGKDESVCLPRGQIKVMYALPGPAYGLHSLTGYNDHNTRSRKRKGKDESVCLVGQLRRCTLC